MQIKTRLVGGGVMSGSRQHIPEIMWRMVISKLDFDTLLLIITTHSEMMTHFYSV